METNRNVLAQLSPRNGDIVWRQVFQDTDPILSFWSFEPGVLTVSGSGNNRFLRFWHNANGRLLWETNLNLEKDGSDSDNSYMAHMEEAGKRNSAFVVLVGNTVVSVNFATGDIKWQWNPSNPNWQVHQISLAMQNSVVHISLKDQASDNHDIINLDLATGAEKEKGNESSIHWGKFSTSGSDSVLGDPLWISASMIAIPFENSLKLYSGNSLIKSVDWKKLLNIPEGIKLYKVELKSLADLSASFLVEYRTSHDNQAPSKAIIDVTTQDGFQLRKSLQDSSVWIASGVSDGNGVIALLTENSHSGSQNTVTIQFLSKAYNFKDVTLTLSAPVNKFYVDLYSRKQSDEPGIRILIIGEDYSITLFREVNQLWMREESLSEITFIECVDLHQHSLILKNNAADELIQDMESSNLITAFAHRWRKHLRLLVSVLSGGGSDAPITVAGVEHILIFGTKVGKLHALNSKTGEFIWSIYLPNQEVHFGKLLRTQSSASAIIIVVSMHKTSKKNEVTYIDPLTGSVLDEFIPPLGLDRSEGGIIDLIKLPVAGRTRIHQSVLVDSNLKGYLTPTYSTKEGVIDTSDIKKNLNSIYFMATSSNALIGYEINLKNNETKIQERWNIPFSSNDIIATIATRSEYDATSSLGRVLGDRRVLYKYLNPLTVAVALLRDPSSERKLLRIFIVDVVSGVVAYQISHENAQGPVHMVLSENWLVYHYFDIKTHQFMLGVVELYESTTPDQRNSDPDFSSFLRLSPSGIAQLYVFPTAITSLSVTQTKLGVTSRLILFGLNSGQVLGIPKRVIDPRRHPGALTNEEKEEGLLPYDPVIPVAEKSVLSYNLTITGVENIVAFPAMLESTSYVVAYGLDLFFIQTSPSQIFDSLTDEFQYTALVLTIVLLIIGIIVTSRLSARKTLNLQWS